MSRRRKPKGRWAWTRGFRTKRRENGHVIGLRFALSSLVTQGLLKKRAFDEFRGTTGLADFAWRVVYNRRAASTAEEALRRARGFVVFIHGWDGSGAIWEKLPALVCQAEPSLTALVPDVNGFGGSPFLEEVPEVAHCDPKGCMRALEEWIKLLRLRNPKTLPRRRKVFVFVGHSMGGAALFYKEDSGWAEGEYGLCALAPALLCNDLLRQGFYKALGVGIVAGMGYEPFDRFKDMLAPRLIEGLVREASRLVKKEHLRIFARTSKGTLAQTFYALSLPQPIPRRSWQHVRVILGHKDRLVGLKAILELLEQHGLSSENIRVVFGDHYFFSVGRLSPRQHLTNRAIVVREILDLYRECRESLLRTEDPPGLPPCPPQ